jgi:predicted RNA-binding Zn ribbon-like protein
MSTTSYRPVPEFFGDHRALDLMNTVMLVNGEAADTWREDADVLHWLTHAGMAPAGRKGAAPAGLLEAGRALRDVTRKLVLDRKAGKRLDLKPLNAALAQGQRHLELVADGEGLAVAEHYATDTPQRLLAPLAEAVADLLATADFNLVRKCEDSDCLLWFLDRTKSHRRRWCSMALCGNRNKVSSFRQRQQNQA